MKKHMKHLKKAAKKGRHGDTQLVHMRPDEVQGLNMLAEATGNQMTTNPETGLKEAFSLPGWVLPAAAIAATVATGGAAAPLAAGTVGGTTAATTAATAAGTGLLEAGTTAALGEAGLAAGSEQAAMLAAQDAGMSAAPGLLSSQAPAAVVDKGAAAGMGDKANYLLGNPASPGGLLESANKVAKPVGTAMQVGQMFTPPPQQPGPTPPVIQSQAPGQGPQTLQNLASQNKQNNMMQQEQQMAQRAKRQQMISRMNSMYRG